MVGALTQAVSGGSLYRKVSFLVDSLGREIFPKHLSITEDPHIKGAMGSSPFDEEGVRTQARDLVRDGVLGALGWRVVKVSCIDWLRDPRKVLDRIEQAAGKDDLIEIGRRIFCVKNFLQTLGSILKSLSFIALTVPEKLMKG